MKQEQLFKNLDSALEESKGMLDTLEAIKGPAYTGVVHKMLIATQITELVELLVKRLSSPENRHAAMIMGKSIAEGVGVILADYAAISGIDPDEQDALIADCERIMKTTKGMLQSAHDAAANGTGFGDRDAD